MEVRLIKYRQLGRAGLRVSVYALGTNAFGGRAEETASMAVIHHALDHGVNLIDTSNSYANTRSETIIGKALKNRRGEAIIASKCGWKIGDGPNDEGASRWHVMREVEGSLRRLQTDYIDLYQIHRFDPHTPPEETLRALDDLIHQGKVRYIGCSNFAAWQVCEALWASDRCGLARYESVQPEYSPANRRIEAELVPLCLDQRLGLLVYFPLAGGVLTGKYKAGSPPPQGSRAQTQPSFGRMTERNLTLAQNMERVAAEVGATVAQLTLAWVMNRPGITSALVGATRVSQQEENLKSVDLELTPEVVNRINELSQDFVRF